MASDVRMQFPRLAPWMRNLLIGLFALYVVELVLANLRVPVDALRLYPFAHGFEAWQPITRFLVQGREGAVGVLFSIVVLYFFLPVLSTLLDRRQWAEALLSTAVAATAIPMLADVTGAFPPALRTGWAVLMPAVVVVFGLAQPNATVLAMFVIPIQASFFVWASLFLSVFFLLVSPSTASLEPVAAWIGIVAWWSLRGPGRRRRVLLAQADRLETEIRKFTVLEGGRSERPQGRPQGRQDDDWIH
jgi:hypothetical protein